MGEQEFRFNMDKLFEIENDFENKSKNVAKNDNIKSEKWITFAKTKTLLQN